MNASSSALGGRPAWPAARSPLPLTDGSRVAVIGGGPAGSFASYFLLVMAERAGLTLEVDVYEPKEFHEPGVRACNQCAGVVSESLVQTLAAEGITLPMDVVRSGLDSYVLHTDQGRVRIEAPLREKRIATVYRGAGPGGERHHDRRSFDGHLLDLAVAKGADRIHARVERIDRSAERPRLWSRSKGGQAYDLVVAAVGLNGAGRGLFDGIGLGYAPPPTRRAYLREFRLGAGAVDELDGAMHVFLLDVPGLEFAAVVPKGDHATLCLLGSDLGPQRVQALLQEPAVRACLPASCREEIARCQCAPRLSVGPAVRPFDDRFVFVGDCAVSRLYKDGIGAAYRTAKAAATTAVFAGVSAADFARHYWPTCRALVRDNRVGRAIFAVQGRLRRSWWVRRALLRLVTAEQRAPGRRRTMSSILWDLFSGSAPYREILWRGMRPVFLLRFLWSMIASMPTRPAGAAPGDAAPAARGLGRWLRDGDLVIRQGEQSDCAYVIEKGQVEVIRNEGEADVRLAVLGEGEVFGEMALLQGERHSASVRARGDVRVLAVDRRTLMRRLAEDPSLAFRFLDTLSDRVGRLDQKLTQLILRGGKRCDTATTIGIMPGTNDGSEGLPAG